MNRAASSRPGGERAALTRRRDFSEVHARGKRARRDGVTVTGAPSAAPEGPTRVGLVVPGSVGQAVVRNRIKRRLRAAVGQLRPVAGFDVVVRADARVVEADFQQLVSDVKRALSRVGVSCEE